MAVEVDITSKFYPYVKVEEKSADFSQYSKFPRQICDYLLDAPKGAYTPIDDNSYPRCRFWKYLFYDGAKPEDNPLPTIAEKMSVLFDPENPTTPPTEKGYRLIPQSYIHQSQETAQTRIYVYMGRTIAANTDNIYATSVVFDIFTHYTYELNTKTDDYSRSGAIVSALVEALNGVNITGVGTFSLSKRTHPDSGTRAIYDGKENVGTELILGLKMANTYTPTSENIENRPFLDKEHKIRFA